MAIPWKPVVDPGIDWNVVMADHHHTKNKGDLGVLKAQIDLFEQGFAIMLPVSEHAPFDLVAYKSGEFKRVQVKYRSLEKSGALQVKFSTSRADRRGTHTSRVNKDGIDLYCIYCPDTDDCYYLDPDQYDSNASLRVETPKNGQLTNVRFAADHRRVP